MTPFLNLSLIRERLAPRERLSAMAEVRRIDLETERRVQRAFVSGSGLGALIATVIFVIFLT